MKKMEVRKSKISGVGIHTLEDIKKGEHIAFVTGKLVKKATKTVAEASGKEMALWYGITDVVWLDPVDTIWRYFNHSCEPNTAIVGTRKVIALRNIKKGEELAFDYSMTDGDLLWEMKCTCGSKKCRKTLYSIQRLDQKVVDRHMPYIPKYFQSLRKKYLSSSNKKR